VVKILIIQYRPATSKAYPPLQAQVPRVRDQSYIPSPWAYRWYPTGCQLDRIHAHAAVGIIIKQWTCKIKISRHSKQYSVVAVKVSLCDIYVSLFHSFITYSLLKRYTSKFTNHQQIYIAHSAKTFCYITTGYLTRMGNGKFKHKTAKKIWTCSRN